MQPELLAQLWSAWFAIVGLALFFLVILTVMLENNDNEDSETGRRNSRSASPKIKEHLYPIPVAPGYRTSNQGLR